MIFAQPPPLSVWADPITINSTTYNETGGGSLTYISEAGGMRQMSAGDHDIQRI